MAQRVTEEIFLERIGRDDYTILGEYKNTNTKVKIKHNICDYEWDVIPNNLIQAKKKGNGCPRCTGKERLTTESFKQRVYDQVGDKYSVLSEIENIYVHVLMRHNECGYEWSLSPLSFMTGGSRCPRCANRERYTTEYVRDKINEITHGEFILDDEYINNYTPMKVIHKECGKTSNIPFTYIVQDIFCCNHCYQNMQFMSSGERKIRDYLERKNLRYDTEYSFSDCRNVNALPFDFVVFDNRIIKCLIEFDGKQHFEPVDWFGGQEIFKKQKERDGIKNKYCEDNNYKLIRIPYYDFENIDKILDEKLSLN